VRRHLIVVALAIRGLRYAQAMVARSRTTVALPGCRVRLSVLALLSVEHAARAQTADKDQRGISSALNSAIT
jgi:hypothetical protein